MVRRCASAQAKLAGARRRTAIAGTCDTSRRLRAPAARRVASGEVGAGIAAQAATVAAGAMIRTARVAAAAATCNGDAVGQGRAAQAHVGGTATAGAILATVTAAIEAAGRGRDVAHIDCLTTDVQVQHLAGGHGQRTLCLPTQSAVFLTSTRTWVGSPALSAAQIQCHLRHARRYCPRLGRTRVGERCRGSRRARCNSTKQGCSQQCFLADHSTLQKKKLFLF